MDSFVSPLTSFLDKIDTLAKLAEEEGKEKGHLISQQPFARPGGCYLDDYDLSEV